MLYEHIQYKKPSIIQPSYQNLKNDSLYIVHQSSQITWLLFSLDFNLANYETIHSKSMLFVKSASEREVTQLVLTNSRTQLIHHSLQHGKRSLSFRVSDGQCQVNSGGIVVVRKCLRYSAFSNASQTSWRWNSFCSMLFNVVNEFNYLIRKHFFFNLKWEMCLSRRFS